ncbi:AraC family transcriptional regulator [Denitrobaculum tricleocarpae]|uniref:AraC family transcriptional regulator n=1 Tax=Denitrobaculum tricleocarpae TaxID=2591009 RepID=A0A545T7W4_9PROT|nr:AraC family transcriptional regulator [Denitrobaculum tricleocarpae]TQV73324.1 AraC family transcriptional regulator [Denitrobaculum tricleocarpae]
MTGKKNRSGGEGIERLCGHASVAQRPRRDWFRNVASAPGLELFEAWFQGHAYDKHRHDTYAIGLTYLGVQAFDYRGAAQVSTAGKVIVLHPDEVHDGHAGSDEGFGYRMLYVSPVRLFEAVRSLSSDAVLPFVPDAVSSDPKLARVIASAFDDGRAAGLEPLATDSLILELAEGLRRNDPRSVARASGRSLDLPALQRVREFLDAAFDRVVSSSELEGVSGLSRYDLARQFRAAYGNSPYRYSLARRLDFARCRLSREGSLAELAVEAGFADQAHFTRMFKSAHGITPARYVRLHKSL